MKRINKLFPLLLCACLSLASCTGSGDKQPEKMCGEWVHVKGSPSFTLSETDGKYSVTRKSNVRGKVLETCSSKRALPYCCRMTRNVTG